MKCEIPNLTNLYGEIPNLTNLVLVLKFNKYDIERLKLMQISYFSYIMLKHSSFFSWTSLIISAKYATW